MKIKNIHAREILDSRGTPTLEAEVLLDNGYRMERVTAVDQFPGTVHVETIIKLVKAENCVD